jgi:outer membrane receptor protein involved in Fe transport
MLAAATGFGIPAFSQQAPTAPATTTTSTAQQDTIQLDPFSVSADQDVGFVAASSLAGGRIATALKDTPVAYSVITKEFLDAFNITNVAEAGQWTTNSNFTQGDNTAYGYGGNADAGATRIRGISANSPTRNFFPYNSASDSFNIDRVDFARGANAILFGSGGAGGTQNTSTKQALFDRRITDVRAQVGSWNRYRFTVDHNQPVNDKIAARVNAMWSTEDHWRERLWRDKQGFHVAGTYKINPKLTLRGEFEYLNDNRTTVVFQYRDRVSAWDGITYDTMAPATGTGSLTAAQLAQRGVERFPMRFVTSPNWWPGEYLNFQNRYRTQGLRYNATSPSFYQGQPIRTVGWTVDSQAMIDSNDGLPAQERFAGALAGSPFFFIPNREDTPLWDDPRHEYPVNGQQSRDAAVYLTYQPFEGFFVELAGDFNEGKGKGDTAQRRGMMEYYIDLVRTLPNGEPNPMFLQPYEERGHYKQKRNQGRDAARLQSAYVRDTRIGKLQFGFMAGMDASNVHNRSSELMLPLSFRTPQGLATTPTDARVWIANGELNQYFAWDRLYENDANRPQNPAWKDPIGGRPSTVVDPITGVRTPMQPLWMWDARREDNVYDSERLAKYLQWAGNFDLFKNRLVLIGAFRRDFVDFEQNRIRNPGDMPAGWDGRSLILRDPAPGDYYDLTYLLKDTQGRVLDPNPLPADARPRFTDPSGALIPLPQYASDRFRDDFDSPDVKQIVNTHSYGLVLNVLPWLGVFGNRSTTYNFGTANQDVFGQFLPPTIAHSKDAGIRVTLPNNRLSFSAGWYETYQPGALVTVGDGFLGNYNAIYDLPPVGDFSGRNSLNIPRFRTNNIASRQTNFTDGYEFELTANLLPNWRLIANYATSDAVATEANIDLVQYIQQHEDDVRRILEEGGIRINPANNQAFIDPALNDPTRINLERAEAAVTGYNNLVNTTIPNISARGAQRVAVLQSVPWTANFATDYRFRQGPLNGLRLGLGVNLRGPQKVGNRGGDTIIDPATGQAVDDPRYDAVSWVESKGYWTSTLTASYNLRFKEQKRFFPKSIQFDLTVENLEGRNGPIFGFTSTGGQNTSGTLFRPNDGTLRDPSRHSVPGNFFYLNPRNFLLTARMEF